MDAFDVLGLAPSLDLDLSTLEQRYRELQRQLHPDRFAQASRSERRHSLVRAVSINDAYRLLKDELRRAELVYARLSGERAADGDTTAEPELLMEVMELREELQGARKRGDLRRARELHGDVSQRQAAARDALKQAFSALAQGHSPASREQAARALSRLRYYKRFQDEVAAIEDELAQ